MSGVLLLALQLGAVACGFVGMSKAIEKYHEDGQKKSNKNGGGTPDGKSRHF